jgi:hypothetical protein
MPPRRIISVRRNIMAEPPIRRNATETKGGINVRAVKWVLGISLLLAVGAMIWTFVAAPQATTPDVSGTTPTSVTAPAIRDGVPVRA